MEGNKHHIPYFDFVRGLAIVFVVFNHSYSGNPLSGTFIQELYLVFREIVTCAVPLFLAESGYFLAKKEIRGWKQYWEFVSGHSFRVWLPMVVWSLPLFFINDHQNLLLSACFMLMGGYSIYYFIALIIQYYVMQPVLAKVERGGVILCFVITCISTAFVCYLMAIKGIGLKLIEAVGTFPIWLVYPTLGYYIRKKGCDYKLWPWIVVLLLGLIACVLESKALYMPYKQGLGATKLSAVFFSCAAIMVLFNNKVQNALTGKSIAYKVLLFLGEISFGIYLTHKYFLDFLVAPFINDTIARTVLTLSLSTAFIVLVKSLIPKIANKYMGFK